MSYILQALKKAEEERGASPRAVPIPRALPPASRPRWPWIVGGAVALAGVAGLTLLWMLGPPAAATAPVPIATAVDPAPPASVPARVERPARPEPAREPSLRPERATALTPVRPPVTRAPSPPERSVAVATPARPAAETAAPPSPARPRGEPTALPAAPAGDLRAQAARLSLQVLSWAPDPKDRFVFVNGRKYGEGQAIEDKFLVERIADDGVVLSYQGERVTLKGP